jgi:hypothetical protein
LLAIRRLFRASSSILPGAVDAGGYTSASGVVWGEDAAVGTRSGGPRRRSGVLIAKVIEVPPWDSPALGGVPGITKSSSLLLSGLSGLATSLPAAVLLYSA